MAKEIKLFPPEPLINEPIEPIDDINLEEKEEIFTIKTGNRSFTLPISLIGISEIVKTFLDCDVQEKELTLNKVEPKIMEIIVEYMNLCKEYNECKDITPPEQPLKTKSIINSAGKDRPKEILEWAEELFNRIGQQGIYELLEACNYMDIKGLLFVMCAYVASQMKGQPLEKISKILDPNDPETGN